MVSCSLVRPTARNKEAELERSGRGQDGQRAVEMAVVAVQVLNDRCLRMQYLCLQALSTVQEMSHMIQTALP